METSRRCRVAAVNYCQEKLRDWAHFEESVTYWVQLAADYSCDFICFPEFLTLQLLSIHGGRILGKKAVEKLSHYTNDYVKLMQGLAQTHQMHIIGGTHLSIHAQNSDCENVAHIFTRDGRHLQQGKIHVTPSEAAAWKVKGWDQSRAIETDAAKIGVLVCYDSEFPELSRHLIDQGAEILFVPFCTDERQGYMRVRHCSQARAIENQCYMVLAGNVGHLAGVHNMDAQYAQSCVLTPCDFGFARDGIAAETQANIAELAIAELDLDALVRARKQGTVRNLADRRPDLYQMTWKP